MTPTPTWSKVFYFIAAACAVLAALTFLFAVLGAMAFWLCLALAAYLLAHATA